MKFRYFLYGVAFLAAFSYGKHSDAQEVPEVSVVVHTISHHMQGRVNGIAWNENNPGLGIRYAKGDFAVQAGAYNNSYFRQTNYVIGEYLPLHVGGFRAGVFAGPATGYATDPMIAAGVTVRYQVSRFGAALRYLPRKSHETSAVYGLEFSIALNR